jgi:hypothetical protein
VSEASSEPADPAASIALSAEDAQQARSMLERVIRAYFWTIFKNVVGWLCILISPVLGILLPGPGGIPLFVVGFALVTLPGKRRITTHVFRGRPVPTGSGLFVGLVTFFSVLVTAGAMWATWEYYEWIVERMPVLGRFSDGNVSKLVAISLTALPVTMIVSWLGLTVVNATVLRWIPGIRRFLRRSLRKYGVRLLPTRRRRIGGRTRFVGDEIIGLDDTQRRRLAGAWAFWRPWLGRVLAVSLTLFILFTIVWPVVMEWEAVEARIGRLDPFRVAAGMVMFAVGLWAFRAVAWGSIVRGLGPRLPWRSATRVWLIGHCARYIPGRSYLALRMELSRQYGVTASQAGVSQRLEETLAVLAAVGLAVVAFWWRGWELLPAWRPVWLAVAAILLAGFALLLVPPVFYRLMPQSVTRVTGRRLGVRRLPASRLILSGGTALTGVVWQGTAVWLLIGAPLESDGVWLAVVGAWGLAWAAGQVSRWVPAGLGVREIVLVGCLSLLLPDSLRDDLRRVFESSAFLELGGFTNLTTDVLFEGKAWQDVWWAFLLFLALLLRLATTAAGIAMAILATVLDWGGLVSFVRGELPAPSSVEADVRSSD